jgi:ABC-type molybdate transport system substrate-binding protein
MNERRHRKPSDRERVLAFGSLTILAAGVAILLQLAFVAKPNKEAELVVYAAVALEPALEAAAANYKREFGLPVRISYGSSGELEGKLKLEHDQGKPRADLFIPADRTFSQRTAAAGLTSEHDEVARLQLVVAFHSGVESVPRNLEELAASGLPYAICNPATGAGIVTKQALTDDYEHFANDAKVAFPQVTEAASAIALAMDLQAGLIWDATATQFELQIVEAPELANATSNVTVNLVIDSQHEEAARKFADYLSTPKAGGQHFKKHGYQLPLRHD